MADKDIELRVNVDASQGISNVENLNNTLDQTEQKLGGIKDKAEETNTELSKGSSSVGGFGKAFDAAFQAVDKTAGKVGGSVKDIVDSTKTAIPIVKTLNNTAITGLKGVKGAIAATGIGALVIALTTVISHWEGFTKAIGLSDDKFKEFKATAVDVLKNIVSGAVGVGNVLLQAILAPVKSNIEAFRGLGNVIKDVFTGNWSQIKKDAQEAISSIGDVWKKGFDFSSNFAAGKEAGEKFVAGVITTFTYKKEDVKKGAGKTGKDAGKELVDKAQQELDKEADKVWEKLLDQKKFEESYKKFVSEEVPKFLEDFSRQLSEANLGVDPERGLNVMKEVFGDPETLKKMVEEYQTYLHDVDAVAGDARKSEEERKEAVVALNLKYWNAITALYNEGQKKLSGNLQKQVEDQNKTNAALSKLLEESAQAEYEHQREMVELSIAPEEEKNQKLYELEQQRLKEHKEYLLGLQAQEKEGTLEYLELAEEIKETNDLLVESAARRLQQSRQSWDQEIQTYAQVAQQIAGIIGSIADAETERLERMVENNEMSQEEAKKQFEVIKGWQIAQTWINALAGSAAALSSPIMMTAGPAGWIAAGVQAAALLTEAAITTNKIRNTKFGGSGAGSGGDKSATSTYQAGPLQLTQDITPAPTMNIPVSSEDTRVYILESDIQQSNSRVRVREENTTW